MLIFTAFVLIEQKLRSLLQKKVLVILKIAIRLRDRQAFMVQSLEILNFYIILPLKQVFCKTQIHFQK